MTDSLYDVKESSVDLNSDADSVDSVDDSDNLTVPQNIFKDLRAASGLSHAALAKEMNVSKHALIRMEQGIYDRPLPSVLEYWLNAGRFLPGVRNSGIHISELSLMDGYESYQEEMRKRAYHYFGTPFQMGLQFREIDPHPFIQLRDKARRLGRPHSTMAISKALCVPQSSLNLWERKWRTQKSVPKTFQTALLHIGYTRYDVKRLISGYTQWREVNK